MAALPGFPQYDPKTGLPKTSGNRQTGSGQLDFTLAETLFPNQNPLAPGFVGGSTPTGGGASTPTTGPTINVQSILESILDPLKNELRAQGVADIGSRNAAVNRALVQFGEIPDFGAAGSQLGFNPGEVVDPATAQAAQSNPYSATKRLAQAQADRIREIKNTLAARGALRSGELGYQLQRAQEASGREQYDARSQLLDYLAGVQQAFADAERQRQSQLAQGGESAVERLLGLFPQGLPSAATQAVTETPQYPSPVVGSDVGGQPPPPPVGSTRAFDDYASAAALKRYLDAQRQRRTL